jgi:hypothetical protein
MSWMRWSSVLLVLSTGLAYQASLAAVLGIKKLLRDEQLGSIGEKKPPGVWARRCGEGVQRAYA